MILHLERRKPPEGRLEIRTWELIDVYLDQINRDRLGDTYAPANLARYIKNLTNYSDFDDQLLYEWTDDRLVIFFCSHLEQPLCVITWRKD